MQTTVANLAYVQADTSGFTERNSVAALTAAAARAGVVFTTFGMHASTGFSLNGARAVLTGTLGWRQAFGDIAQTSTFSLAGSDAFTVRGAPIAEDAAIIAARLDFTLSPQATLGISYGGQLASGSADQTLSGTLRIDF